MLHFLLLVIVIILLAQFFPSVLSFIGWVIIILAVLLGIFIYCHS